MANIKGDEAWLKKNESLSVSRRDFLKTAGALGLLAAAGGSIPLSIFSTGCTQGQPAGSQVLTVNLAGEPAQIDPNRASWAAERSVISQVFEGLLGFDKNLAVIAVVAKEIPPSPIRVFRQMARPILLTCETMLRGATGPRLLPRISLTVSFAC